MSKQQWREVCDETAAMPIPGIGVLMRYNAKRVVVDPNYHASEVTVSTSLVLIPGAALRPTIVDGRTQFQVVEPGIGNRRYVGDMMPAQPVEVQP